MKAFSIWAAILLLFVFAFASVVRGAVEAVKDSETESSPWLTIDWRYQPDLVNAILESGADGNFVLPNGKTILVSAVGDHDIGVVRVLLAQEAVKVDLPDELGMTPLMRACALQNLQMVQTLLGAGADASLQDKFGRTAALLTVNTGTGDSVAILEELLAAGADMNTADYRSVTPLMLSVDRGLESSARFLLARGHADIGAQDDQGRTALHRKITQSGQWAGEPWFETARTSMIRLLMELGADPHAVDEEGKSAVDLAVEGGRIDLAEMMVKMRRE